MTVKQPWTQGISQSLGQFNQNALQIFQAIAAIKKQKQQEEAAEMQNKIKLADMNFGVMGNKNVPSVIKGQAYENIRKTGLFPDMPAIDKWTDAYDEYSKRAQKIFQEFQKGTVGFDFDNVKNMFAELSVEAGEAAKEAVEPIQKRVDEIQKAKQGKEALKKLIPTQQKFSVPGGQVGSEFAGVGFNAPPMNMERTVQPGTEDVLSALNMLEKGSPLANVAEKRAGKLLFPEDNTIQTPYGALPAEQAYHYMPELKKDTIPSALEEFETVTGIPVEKRGTPGYRQAYSNWLKEKRQTTYIVSPGQQYAKPKFAMDLRKEFSALKEVKDFKETRAKYSVMNKAYQSSLKSKNFVAIDQALITLFNKMTDPESVVRESEYARTAGDLALINRIQGKAEKIMSGGAGLTADERSELRRMAGKFMEAYQGYYDGAVTQYRRIAGEAGISPNDVVKEEKPVLDSGSTMRDIAPAIKFLKGAKNRNEAKARMKNLLKQGWTEEELQEIDKQAGW